jgi:phosphinothricin acetyltransferase
MVKFDTLQARPWVPQDFETIAEIYNQAIAQGGITFDEDPCNASDIQDWVTHFNDRETLLVLEQEHTVWGWGMIKRYSDRPGYRICCQTSIYLDRAITGQGYGSCLQQALMDQLVKFDYHHVVVKIVASNQGSIRFHQRFGFEWVGIQQRIGYSRGIWYDVALLQWVRPTLSPPAK